MSDAPALPDAIDASHPTDPAVLRRLERVEKLLDRILAHLADDPARRPFASFDEYLASRDMIRALWHELRLDLDAARKGETP